MVRRPSDVGLCHLTSSQHLGHYFGSPIPGLVEQAHGLVTSRVVSYFVVLQAGEKASQAPLGELWKHFKHCAWQTEEFCVLRTLAEQMELLAAHIR